MPKDEREPTRTDCGNCYGNGCSACRGRGWVETDAGREAREEWEDGAYDRARDDRLTSRFKLMPVPLPRDTDWNRRVEAWAR